MNQIVCRFSKIVQGDTSGPPFGAIIPNRTSFQNPGYAPAGIYSQMVSISPPSTSPRCSVGWRWPSRQVVTRDGQRDCFRFIYCIKVCSNPRSYAQFDNYCRAVWKCRDVTWDVRWSTERDRTSESFWHSNFDNATSEVIDFFTSTQHPSKSLKLIQTGVSACPDNDNSTLWRRSCLTVWLPARHIVHIQRRRHV